MDAKLIAFFIFLLASAGLIFLFTTLPPFTKEQKEKLKLPRSIQDVNVLADIISNYKDTYYLTVLIGFSMVYIFLQTFSIPGSIFLSFLAGTLFGPWIGVPLVCFLSACGASGSYFLSYLIGRPIIDKYFTNYAKIFGDQVEKNRNNLFNYFLFLRFSPLLPNWFINLASPIFNVPFHIFWFGTFIGVSAQTFIAVRAGLTLQDIKSPNDVLDIRYIAALFGLAFLSLLPTLKPVQNLLDKILLSDNSNNNKNVKMIDVRDDVKVD